MPPSRTCVRLQRANRERLHLMAPATGAWLRATGGLSCTYRPSWLAC